MITDLQKEKLSQYFRNQSVELVYLFGSQAKGRPTPLSDYDLAVLFSCDLGKKARFNLKLKFMADLGEVFASDKVEILDLNDAPAALRYSAFAPRQEIFVKDEGERINFEFQTMNDYFDRQFYLQRHSATSLATIAREGLNP